MKPRQTETRSDIPAEEHARQRTILTALAHIQSHLDEPLSIESLAEFVGYSPSHFRLMFQGIVGESVHQHIRRLRLERAAALLMLDNGGIDELARRVGFDAREAFTRAFSSAFGLSPTAFRAEISQRKSLATRIHSPSGVHDQGGTSIPPGCGSLRDPQLLPGANQEGQPAGCSSFQPLPNRANELSVRIESIPDMTLACIRHVGLASQAHQAWLKLLPWAWCRNLLAAKPIYFGVNYDDEAITAGESFRYDAGILVAESFAGDGEVFPLKLPGGPCAVCSFAGDFAAFDAAWNIFLYQWLPRSGYELRECFGFDRYHPPADLLSNPVGAVWRLRNRIEADLCIPVRRSH